MPARFLTGMGPQKSLSARALAATARAVATGHLGAPCAWKRMPTPVRTKSGSAYAGSVRPCARGGGGGPAALPSAVLRRG
eukprot:2130598-Pyramimonas_sp.AAC.1